MQTGKRVAGLVLLAAGTAYARGYLRRRASNRARSLREMDALAALAGGPGTDDRLLREMVDSTAGTGPVVVSGLLERTVDAYGTLVSLNRALAPGALAMVVVPNAAEGPRRPYLDPLGWLEARAGNRRAEALTLFRMVTPDGTGLDIHYAPADLRRLAVDAGFDVVAEGGLLGPRLYLTLRKAREPRQRPRKPWWPQHAVDRLPLDYMTTREDVLDLVPAESARVLDVGCAAGALGMALRERGAAVTGIELDPPLAALAGEVLDEVVVGDAVELLRAPRELAGEPFDCVIFADCLEHLVDPWSTLRDAVARLEPGGVAVVSLPNIRHWDTLWQVGVKGTWPRRHAGIHDATHLRQFTRRDAVALLEDAGLEVTLVKPVHRVLEDHATPLDGLASILPGAAGELVTFQWLLVGRKPALHHAAEAVGAS